MVVTDVDIPQKSFPEKFLNMGKKTFIRKKMRCFLIVLQAKNYYLFSFEFYS